MKWKKILALSAFAIAACQASLPTALAAESSSVVYQGARLLIGDGAVIENGAFQVENGKITKVGPRNAVPVPAGATAVDLSGKTVMPTLFNAHSHPGWRQSTTPPPAGVTMFTVPGGTYSRETILEDLRAMTYYGVLATQSFGIEKGPDYENIQQEQTAGTLKGVYARLLTGGTGIGSKGSSPFGMFGGIAHDATNEQEVRGWIRENKARHVNANKIWVDDRGMRATPLAPNLYRAAIDESHKTGVPVFAHVFRLEHAKDLVNSGLDGFAHLVRDKEMDDELVAEIVKRKVIVIPSVQPNSVVSFIELPSYLKEGSPFMRMAEGAMTKSAIDAMRKPYPRDPAAVAKMPSKDALYWDLSDADRWTVMSRSINKLAKAGARLATGTDSVSGAHVHNEMFAFVRAGLTPMQAVVAATGGAADALRVKDLGTIAVGKEASFLVLDANPLDDINNTAAISKMYVKGVEFDRKALGAELIAKASR